MAGRHESGCHLCFSLALGLDTPSHNGERNTSTRPSFPRHPYRPGGPIVAKASVPPTSLPFPLSWVLWGGGEGSILPWDVTFTSGPICSVPPHPPTPSANPHKARRRARHDKQARTAHTPPAVLGGAEAGFGAAVTLSVRSSNWIPNTQRSAETLGRGNQREGASTNKERRSSSATKTAACGWEGTLVKGCPSGGGRGRESPSRRQGMTGLLPPAWCFPISAYMPSCPLSGLGVLQGLASDSPLPWEAFLERGGGKARESVAQGPAPDLPPAAPVRVRRVPAVVPWPVSSSVGRG